MSEPQLMNFVDLRPGDIIQDPDEYPGLGEVLEYSETALGVPEHVVRSSTSQPFITFHTSRRNECKVWAVRSESA